MSRIAMKYRGSKERITLHVPGMVGTYSFGVGDTVPMLEADAQFFMSNEQHKKMFQVMGKVPDVVKIEKPVAAFEDGELDNAPVTDDQQTIPTAEDMLEGVHGSAGFGDGTEGDESGEPEELYPEVPMKALMGYTIPRLVKYAKDRLSLEFKANTARATMLKQIKDAEAKLKAA